METNIIPFIYDESPVRVLMDGEKNPWFVAKDVCNILELGNPTEAIRDLEDDEKGLSKVETIRGPREVNIINEPGLYTLVFRSNKPKAKTFRRWVTHEVLPSLRKTGAYNMPAENIPADPVSTQPVPDHVWQRIREMEQGVKPHDRVKLLSLACSMNRIDQTVAHSRAGILLDYADLCHNLFWVPPDELMRDEDGIQEFTEECCFLKPTARSKASKIYNRYVEWYFSKYDTEAPNITRFGRHLARKYRKSKTNGCVIYQGIGIRGEEDAIDAPGLFDEVAGQEVSLNT